MVPASTISTPRRAAPRRVTAEPPFVRWLLISVALVFLGLFLFVPLAAVFAEAFAKGIGFYLHTFNNADAMSAIKLTLIVAGIAVPLNCVFGVAAAWAIAKFDFRGKNILITLIDLPFSVSPDQMFRVTFARHGSRWASRSPRGSRRSPRGSRSGCSRRSAARRNRRSTRRCPRRQVTSMRT